MIYNVWFIFALDFESHFEVTIKSAFISQLFLVDYSILVKSLQNSLDYLKHVKTFSLKQSITCVSLYIMISKKIIFLTFHYHQTVHNQFSSKHINLMLKYFQKIKIICTFWAHLVHVIDTRSILIDVTQK